MIDVERVFKDVQVDDEDRDILEKARTTLKGLAEEINSKYPEYTEKNYVIKTLRDALFYIELTMAQQDKYRK